MPPVLLVTAMPGVLLATVVLDAGHIRLAREAALGWPGVVRRVAGELEAGWAAVDAQLPDAERDGEVGRPLRVIREATDSLRQAAEEAEAAIAEVVDPDAGPRG